MTKTLRSDATPMMRGAIYQLCVALDICYQLRPGQSVYVEEFGDVSVPGEAQTEVKMYSSPLTSNPPNFWNTLYNWSEPASRSEEYQFLILHTTQEFGANSRLAEFNDSTAAGRSQLLLEINKESERDFANRSERNKSSKPSPTLLQQRALLHGDRKPLLEKLIGRIYIETISKEFGRYTTAAAHFRVHPCPLPATSGLTAQIQWMATEANLCHEEFRN